MSPSSSIHHPMRDALRWLIVIPAFPLSGLLVTTLIGPVDSPLPALAGGAIVGLAVGAAQLFGLNGRARTVRWLAASTLGGGFGLLVGSALVGYASTLTALALQGAVTGVIIGSAQAIALPRAARRIGWALGITTLWTLGWLTTALIGVDVDRHYAVFGASGALVATLGFAALSALTMPARSRATGTSPVGDSSPSALTSADLSKGTAS